MEVGPHVLPASLPCSSGARLCVAMGRHRTDEDLGSDSYLPNEDFLFFDVRSSTDLKKSFSCRCENSFREYGVGINVTQLGLINQNFKKIICSDND